MKITHYCVKHLPQNAIFFQQRTSNDSLNRVEISLKNVDKNLRPKFLKWKQFFSRLNDHLIWPPEFFRPTPHREGEAFVGEILLTAWKETMDALGGGVR